MLNGGSGNGGNGGVGGGSGNGGVGVEEAGHAPYPLLSRAESRPGEG